MKSHQRLARIRGLKAKRHLTKSIVLLNFGSMILTVHVLNRLFNFVDMTGMQILALALVAYVLISIASDIKHKC
jgi:hypothetical protein